MKKKLIKGFKEKKEKENSNLDSYLNFLSCFLHIVKELEVCEHPLSQTENLSRVYASYSWRSPSHKWDPLLLRDKVGVAAGWKHLFRHSKVVQAHLPVEAHRFRRVPAVSQHTLPAGRVRHAGILMVTLPHAQLEPQNRVLCKDSPCPAHLRED